MTFPHTIRYWADLNPATGFNNAARGYAKVFEALGIGPDQLRLVPAVASMPNAADIDDPAGDWLWSYLRGQAPHEYTVNIVHLPPTKVPRHLVHIGGAYNIAITAWETDRLPEQFMTQDGDGKPVSVVDGLNRFDDIWVPTQLVKAVFVKAGVLIDKIAVIPHALLPALLEMEPRSEPPRVPDKHPALIANGDPTLEPVRFYCIASWNERKNVEAILRAYAATGWTQADPVELTLHCVPPTVNPGIIELHNFQASSALERLRASGGTLPNIGLHLKPRAYEWIAAQHRDNHVFVTASRGEGFGIPILEALAMGNVVVASDRLCKPFEDVAGYVDDTAAIGAGVDSHTPGHRAGGALINLECNETPIVPMPEIEGYELDQRWWDVSIDELRQGFLEAFELVKGGRMPMDVASKVRDAYSPAALAPLVEERLKRAEHALRAVGW